MPSLALLKVVLHLFIINYHIITKKPTFGLFCNNFDFQPHEILLENK